MAEANDNAPFNHTDKKSGDPILSADWNNAMNEVVRLEKAKVNRQGADTIQGPLTIEAALTLNDKVGIGGAPGSEQLKVQGDATITGNLKAIGAIVPSTGDTENNGIMFPKDAWGGSGDAAWIRYYRRGTSGEASTLAISIANDADDHIALMPNSGNVGIGIANPTAKLDIRGGSLQIEGSQKIIFQDGGLTNNLKLQLRTSYGLGINTETLFYTADGNHSWRDKASVERMKLTTATNGGLTVLGTGKSSFAGDLTIAGKVGIGRIDPIAALDIQSVARTNLNNHPSSSFVNGLYVTGTFGEDNNGVEFRHTNGTQGIGFGYNTIYATGINSNQDLSLKARGTGTVKVKGDFNVTGKIYVGSTSTSLQVVASSREVLRIVRGSVNSNGSLISGDGFSSTRNDTGRYTIMFNPAFQVSPTVVATQKYAGNSNWGGNTKDNCLIAQIKKNECRIITGNNDGGYSNRDFEFIAMGS